MKKQSHILFLALILSASTLNLWAIDGAGLFKSRCNTCHMVDKNSTGPKLQGVKQKWTDAGEGENLYRWVQNSTELISSGKSALAKEISGFSATAMPAQALSNEEIDAVFSNAVMVDKKGIPTGNTSFDQIELAVWTDKLSNLSMSLI